MGKQLKKKDVETRSTADKLAEFGGYTMAHPLLKDAYDQIVYEVEAPTNDPLIFVAGPTGVGKSTLFKALYKKIVEDEMNAMLADQHYIPVAGMEVIAYDGGQFRWKDFNHRYLNALLEPMIDKKLKNATLKIDDVHDGDLTKKDLAFAPGLRRAMEKALKRRGVKAFLLDEAQHLAKVRSGGKLLDQLDYVKSLANTSGVKHVLFGTYQMLSMWNLSGQLARRSKIIHLHRYRMTVDEEVEMFRAIIQTFEDNLPLPEKSQLGEHWEDIYVRCAGCVGILKVWLHRVLAVALKQNLPVMDYSLMKKYSLSSKQLQKIADEIIRGEKTLMDSEEGYETARLMLMKRPAKAVAAESKEQEKPRSGKKKRVGERKPTHDKVGRKRSDDDDEMPEAA